MAKKTVRRSEFEDFKIMENGAVVGTLRVKPSGIQWKPKGKHKWLGITMEQFAEFAQAKGKEQVK